MEPLRGVVQTYDWGVRDMSCQVRYCERLCPAPALSHAQRCRCAPACAARLWSARGAARGAALQCACSLAWELALTELALFL